MRIAWAAILLPALTLLAADKPITFRSQEIAKDLGIVYAVSVADVNGDHKPDIVAINQRQIVWFENPSWAKHVVAERITEKDNVAIAPADIDGDGKMDFALAADWQATNTTSGGSLHWISHEGKAHDITTEPTLHRIRWADINGDGRPELIAVPLHGRGTKAADWTDGPGSSILVFTVPPKPAEQRWPVEVACDSLHIVHNFISVGREIWVASAEGVFALSRSADGKWSKRLIAEGKPGEIKMGRVNGKRYLATVEPWHGSNLVIFEETSSGPWARTVAAMNLDQGHALGWGDFDRDGNDELVVGWRGGKTYGLALYRLIDGKWTATPVDDGVAVEDLAVADLDGDGVPEIIAGGRATSNLRIYWRR
jgi:hypothetical protein